MPITSGDFFLLGVTAGLILGFALCWALVSWVHREEDKYEAKLKAERRLREEGLYI